MLNETKASGAYYDAPTDVLRLVVTEPPGASNARTVAADLLLDAKGFLVGVDVEPGSASRTVVMLGPHESVARTVAARVGVSSDSSGSVLEVRVGGAGAAIRGHEKNPYA